MPPRRVASTGQAVPFRWGRRRLSGQEGDTVASALLAAGETILSRSIKYHRPRSYLCGVGKCGNCLVTIDGKPSQRACMVPLREGMEVQGQNAWPSPRRDVMGLTDRVFARGFDPQHFFTRPAFLVPLYYAVVRQMAGLGKAPRDPSPPRPAAVAKEEVALAVVGAGPAGLAAAWEAGMAGVEVALFDEGPWPGGRLAQEMRTLSDPDAFAGQTPAQAREFLLRGLREAGCAPRSRATVAGYYGERLLAVLTPQRLTEVRAGAVVLATGAPESLPLFEDNDRPGIMGAQGAALLLHRHGVLPGQRVVLAGSDPRLLDLGSALSAAGAEVVAIVAEQPPAGAGEVRVVRGRVARAFGAPWLTGVEVSVGGERQRLACDLLVHGEPRRPAVELAQQAGCTLAWRDGVLAPKVDARLTTSVAKVWACGDLVAPGSLEAALASGRVAGLHAAQALGRKVDEARLAAAEDAWTSLGARP